MAAPIVLNPEYRFSSISRPLGYSRRLMPLLTRICEEKGVDKTKKMNDLEIFYFSLITGAAEKANHYLPEIKTRFTCEI